jgi:hypothetical protein
MKTLAALGWGLLALTLAAGPAWAGGLLCRHHRRHCAAAPECPPPVCTVQEPCVEDKLCFHVEITEEKCKVPGKPEWKVTESERECKVARVKQVPVCVTDPCTGCTHTEFKEEVCPEKVKTKVFDVCFDKCPEEEKVKKCVKIVVNHKPVVVMKEVPVPCPESVCGH